MLLYSDFNASTIPFSASKSTLGPCPIAMNPEGMSTDRNTCFWNRFAAMHQVDLAHQENVRHVILPNRSAIDRATSELDERNKDVAGAVPVFANESVFFQSRLGPKTYKTVGRHGTRPVFTKASLQDSSLHISRGAFCGAYPYHVRIH